MKRLLTIMLIVVMLCSMALSVVAEPNFQITILSNEDAEKQGEPVNIKTSIKNIGTTGSMRVEAGIYTKSTITNWYGTLPLSLFGFNLENVDNCGLSNNVETILLELDADQTFIHTFQPKAPLTNPDDEYVIHVNSFVCCYKDCGSTTGTGQTDWEVTSFDLLDDTSIDDKETCSDDIQNQDETDTDVGGVCGLVPDFFNCDSDSDCISDNCISGKCKPCDVQEECSEWSLCSSGKQTRTCDDTNDCGITSQSQTERSCTTLIDTTGKTKFTSAPTVSSPTITIGDSVTVTATFHAETTGAYLLEAGTSHEGPLSALSVVDITENNCDPAEDWYANKVVDLQAGDHEISFTVTPEESGKTAYWVAYVTECGGDVINQVGGETFLSVVDPNDSVGGKSVVGGLNFIQIGIIVLALILIGLGIYALVRRKN